MDLQKLILPTVGQINRNKNQSLVVCLQQGAADEEAGWEGMRHMLRDEEKMTTSRCLVTDRRLRMPRPGSRSQAVNTVQTKGIH